MHHPWYKDPFKSCETEGSTSQTPEQGRSNPHPQHTGAGELPEAGPSQQRGSGDHGRLDNQRGGKKGGGGKRYSPYQNTRDAKATAASSAKISREKFAVFEAPEMPP
ncbi:hypothetical protein B0H10DRAFT_2207257 [Mycena sp. CBHHK59/15]|nr:hypothetical protein B0H10DRAFT_2207257 [Mycena sp. CBHHK59/15]